jgi:ribulose-phosphate 3-epimerase
MVLISPSILSADFLYLHDEIMAIEQTSADFIHIDIMDGHFVPNLTFGPFIIRAIKNITKLPLDVHLMISNPGSYIEAYASSGADLLTIHVESCIHLERTIKQIKSHKIKAGVALNPSTHESVLQYVLKDLDLVLIMSVNPGFSGQNFLPAMLKKIAAVKVMVGQVKNRHCLISIDGGINDQTAKLCIQAGASSLVAGSYIFNSSDYQRAVLSLKHA